MVDLTNQTRMRVKIEKNQTLVRPGRAQQLEPVEGALFPVVEDAGEVQSGSAACSCPDYPSVRVCPPTAVLQHEARYGEFDMAVERWYEGDDGVQPKVVIVVHAWGSTYALQSAHESRQGDGTQRTRHSCKSLGDIDDTITLTIIFFSKICSMPQR